MLKERRNNILIISGVLVALSVTKMLVAFHQADIAKKSFTLIGYFSFIVLLSTFIENAIVRNMLSRIDKSEWINRSTAIKKRSQTKAIITVLGIFAAVIVYLLNEFMALCNITAMVTVIHILSSRYNRVFLGNETVMIGSQLFLLKELDDLIIKSTTSTLTVQMSNNGQKIGLFLNNIKENVEALEILKSRIMQKNPNA